MLSSIRNAFSSTGLCSDGSESPESLLARFTQDHGRSCFWYTDLDVWLQKELGEASVRVINAILNLEGVIELGDVGYKSPYPA
ncbi:hypothetical protein [Neptuniibacter sp. QD37_11]|uniref:hypothetical protein n=1 Tax=Neptuniibacter sp. QD37_11 TaxID=3398209 RepID=UPI0039F4BE5A